VRNEKYKHGGLLKFKINVLLYGNNSWTIALRETNFCTWKIMDIATSFIWVIIFFNRPFEYGDGGIFKLLRWIQNLQLSRWDHNILYRGWTTFNKTTFVRILKFEHYGQLKFKLHILLYGENSWTIALRQMKFCTLKDHGHTYKFYLNHYFLWWSFWMWQYLKILRLCCGKH
jgi:hypothetical protein